MFIHCRKFHSVFWTYMNKMIITCIEIEEKKLVEYDKVSKIKDVCKYKS